jgi:hypothetical protein
VRVDSLFDAPAPTNSLTHTAVVEKTEEEYNGWIEHVNDEQYQKGE